MKKWLIISMLAAGTTLASEVHQFRQWSTAEDKKVFARFVSYTRGYVKLRTYDKKHHTVPFKRLSEDDRLQIWRLTRDKKIDLKSPTLTEQHRKTIPSLNQTQFGETNNNCGPNAVTNFLLWWDQNGLIQLPEKEEELDKLADDIHKDLESAMRSNNGTDEEEFVEGFKKYLKKKDLTAKYNFKLESKEANEENLQTAAQGANLSVLALSTLKNGRHDEGHYVSLISYEDNLISFNTWGHKLHGKLVPGILDKKKIFFIELVREPGTPVYNWITERGGGFYISETDKVFTLTVEKKPKKAVADTKGPPIDSDTQG